MSGAPEALTCRREFPERAHARCGKPAEFIVWGKLFPKEALGPRCYDCAAEQTGSHHGLVPGNPQGYAIYHLPDLKAIRSEAIDAFEDGLLSGNLPERIEKAIRSDERSKVVGEARSQIKALRVYNDEEIAAKRGAMEGWVRIDDVLLALDHQESPDE